MDGEGSRLGFERSQKSGIGTELLSTAIELSMMAEVNSETLVKPYDSAPEKDVAIKEGGKAPYLVTIDGE